MLQKSEMPTEEQRKKLDALRQYLKDRKSVLVAYSGGVDSTFLLQVAHETLGERAAAVTAKTCLNPARESEETDEFCEKEGIRHLVLSPDVLAVPGFAENPKNRCYLCKKSLFTEMKKLAEKEGFAVVAEGSNKDDLGDYRPGLQAIAELQIASPLRACGLYKADIRALSRMMELPTWKKASFACLASRIPYGDPVTEQKLQMVDRAESVLLAAGFEQFRVRIHGDLARIEVLPKDLGKIMEPEIRETIVQKFRKIGFSYIALDLQGYRTGSLNETIEKS